MSQESGQCGQASLISSKPFQANIWALFVLPAWEKRGIGKRLLHEAFSGFGLRAPGPFG